MKKYLYKLGLLALTGMMFSCEIAELPSTSITEEELAGNASAVNAVVLGNYAQLKTQGFTKGYHYLGEYGSDNVALSGSTTDALMNIYNFQRIKTNGHLSNQWGVFNRIVINCNKLIELNPTGEDQKLNHSIGECYFLRGWIFYQLAQTFGRTYHVATENEEGTPVKLSSKQDDLPLRTTVKKQYEQIVSDLKKAEELMLNSGVKKEAIYANVWAAKALLSRVYLTMHDYVNAEKYATDVIENSGKTLIGAGSYKTMNEIVPESNPEAIFSIRRVKDIDNGDPSNEIGSLYARLDGTGWGEMYASEPLRDLLDMYPNDVRSAFIVPQYDEFDYTEFSKTEKVQQYEFIGKSRNYLIDNDGNEDPMVQGKYRTYFRFGDVGQNAGGDWVFLKKLEKGSGGIGLTDKISSYAFQAIANHEMAKNDSVVHQDANGFYINVKQRRSFKKTGETENTIIYGPVIKVYGKIQKKMPKRNDYPKYFMTKCSYQDKQTHMWSPMVLRLSEMYLNRAEARLLKPAANQSGAIEDMNVIKSRAGIPNYSAATDGADVLKAVLDERRRELYLEAQRYFDLMRNDMPLDRAYPGGHDRGASSAVKLTVINTDNCAIQYIPQREIDAYKPIVLTQNPD